LYTIRTPTPAKQCLRPLGSFAFLLPKEIAVAVKLEMAVDLSSYRDQHFKVHSMILLVLVACDNRSRSHFQGTRGEQERLLRTTTTLYIGNLSFYTTEEQLYELFGKCGDVKRIIMG
jgi:hypothetical protein